MSKNSSDGTSPAARVLRLRKRNDLVVQRQEFLGRRCWLVKDPISLKYHRLEEEEFELFEMLDGRCTLGELQSRFEKRSSHQRITIKELHQFIGMLHGNGLVLADAPEQEEHLIARTQERSKRHLRSTVASLLSPRLRLGDPNRFLGNLDRCIGWVFSRQALAFNLVFIAAALLLVAANFEVFRQKLPGLREFTSTQNWVWLAVALAFSKGLHELGHGLCCRRLGGECHEMGVMFMLATPCLYCNVTDSCLLPNKWHRAAIGAAGMYVELVLAAFCTFLWWFSAPGLLHGLCLNVMFVSSVSTLVFNANPLLRCDGYYILSDLIEIPGLRQKASAVLQRRTGAWILGVSPAPDLFPASRFPLLLAAYGLASAVYRWLVAVGVLWFLHIAVRPCGVQIFGLLLPIVAVHGFLIRPAWQVARFFRIPGRVDQVKPRRLIAAGSAVVLAFACLWIPLPAYVRCSLHLEPGGATPVYSESAGCLGQIHAKPGDWVRAGQPLVTLENVDVRLGLVRLQNERQRLIRNLERLRQMAVDDPQAASRVAEVELAIAALGEQCTRHERDNERLCVVAPVSGVVLPAAVIDRPVPFGQLPSWTGSPLDEQNLRAFLGEGVPICHIGDPRRFRVILAIDPKDREFVRPGQAVQMVMSEQPLRYHRAELEQVSPVDMKPSREGRSTKQGGPLGVHNCALDVKRPFDTPFQASASLTDPDGQLWIGATGEGKIRVGSRSLAQSFWRYLCQTFRLAV